MNALNQATTAVFDWLLWLPEQLGRVFALCFASAVFGVFALWVFKQVSPQRRIKEAKERIKAHLIEIRIWQDDLRIVGIAIGKVLGRNLQYLALNLTPFLPLFLPFALVVAQFVVRYGFAPVPTTPPGMERLAGAGTTIDIELAATHASRVGELVLVLPPGVEQVSPLVVNARDGRAFVEVVARESGVHELAFELDGARATKLLAAGAVAPRTIQGERGTGCVDALLWPAEPAFDEGSPFVRIRHAQPDADLGFLPGGPGGIVLSFLVLSMLAGALAIKPLKVQI